MRYFGGKNLEGVYQRIINLIPKHSLYFEPFAGSAAIARHKRPADVTILCDLSGSIDENDYGIPCEFHRTCGIEFLLENFDLLNRPDVFIYADPPYLLSTRTSSKRYDHELTFEQHRDLTQLFSTMSAAIAISGYVSSLYTDALSNWKRMDYPVVTRGGSTRTESLWMNYDPPAVPDTLDYVGSNFTDRQRIKRKAARWVNRFKELPLAERAYIIEALNRESAFDLD